MIDSRGRAMPGAFALVLALFLIPLTIDVGPKRPTARGGSVATARRPRIIH